MEHNNRTKNGARIIMHPSKAEQTEQMRNFFNPQTFPKEFENWSLEEQDEYFEQKIEKYAGLPKFLMTSTAGIYRNVRAGNIPSEIPEWADAEKIRRGQEFFRKNFLQASLSIIAGHFVLYTFHALRQGIDVTRKSYTPYTTFSRFVGTMSAVRNMIKEDLFIKASPGYASAEKGRKVHGAIDNMCARKTVAELNEMCRIKKPWSTALDILLEDFREVIPELEIDYRTYAYDYDAPWRPKGISQSTMSFAMIGLMGPYIENPKFFGVHDATDQNIDDVCHLLRLITYYLGVDDKYNLYNCPLPEVRQRMRSILEMYAIPNLREINATWEHMMRCLAVGASYYVPFISFECYLLFTMDYLNIPVNKFRGSIGFLERVRYRILRFLIDHVMKWRLVSRIANKIFDYAMNRILSFGPKEFAALEEHSNKTLLAASVIL